MNGGKGSLCCCAGGSLEVNMLLSHTAWHITLISSSIDASGPKQTHTHPKEEYRRGKKLNQTMLYGF